MRDFLFNRLLWHLAELKKTSTTTYLPFKNLTSATLPSSMRFSIYQYKDACPGTGSLPTPELNMDKRRMGLSDILIMDFDPHSCSVDHCGQIANLLQNWGSSLRFTFVNKCQR